MSMPEISIIDNLPNTDLRGWLARTATTYGCTYLLAHAEDGVIWGRLDSGTLITSHDVFASHCRATIRFATLWEARLFGENAEVLLWRTDGAWQARVIHDAKLKANEDYLIEQQMLWGDHAEDRARGFTLLADGSEGLRYAVPIDVADATLNATPHPVRLCVHHYFDFDGDGNAHIGLSRLVNICEV